MAQKAEDHLFQIMVFECKRVRQAAWVFLIPQTAPSQYTHVRLFDSQHSDARWKRFDWHSDWETNPESYESKYCSVPGQEQGRRNLLERTAAEIAEATEALAHQEKALADTGDSSKLELTRIYIPVIVTTADLAVAHFEPGSVSLQDGCLPHDTRFVRVPYVRFRKALTTEIEIRGMSSISNEHARSERTIFVVNAEELANFLEAWEIGR